MVQPGNITLPEFSLPELSELSVAELRDLGHKLNGQREQVLAKYKEVGSALQAAIVKQEEKEIAERKANDPDYDKKHQGIGGKVPTE